jgi:outer membrane protein OmpA-like peptidoglycan-associated protein
MEKGLLASQQQTLKTLAADFKAYLDVHPETQLVLIGHADKRGSKHYNQALSERRAEAAKAFLVEQGVPAEKIQTKAFGKEQNLTREQVKELIATNAEATEEARKKALRRLPAMIYANNRRVDMQLSTTGQESVRTYPFAAGDFSKLMR